ncbi:MAG: nucleotidyltransferase domain-containing protein [Firmicutes bacterium]|nr:nucleotidyltransferase domain-containing protein [Bacillota bacterium]
MDPKSVEDRVVERIVTHFPAVERIILFGSHARGDARPDSDWDFLIIMPSEERTIRRGIAIRQVARIPGIPMDFLVRTPSEVQDGVPMMANDIVNEGKILYERPH